MEAMKPFQPIDAMTPREAARKAIQEKNILHVLCVVNVPKKHQLGVHFRLLKLSDLQLSGIVQAAIAGAVECRDGRLCIVGETRE